MTRRRRRSIRTLPIAPGPRGQAIGSRRLIAAEVEAARRDGAGIRRDTMIKRRGAGDG
jgi:hypothetical protein